MKKRQSLAALLALCLCLPALSGCAKDGDSDSQTAAADIGTIENVVEDTGTAAHRDPYTILPTVSGKILSCTFEEGDTVKEGDTLYVIDSTALEDQITQAELSLKNARQAYAQAVDACDDLTVHAKAAGTVTAVYVHVGDYVSAGTPIANVVDRENLLLTVPFAPADAAAMTPGAAATITFTSFSGSVTGTVQRVYDAATSLSGGREAVYVEISFTNPGALNSGATAYATVGTASCMEAGTVSNGTEQSIYATQSGQVLTLAIDAGNTVSVGQAVMTIDNASLTNARDSASLACETASVSLSQLVAKRADYILLAPADGVMITRSAKEGDIAAVGAPLAVLAQEESLCINASIDEIYIDRIFAGQEALVSFTTDTGEERTYNATVRRVDDTGITSGGVTDYVVELSLESTEGLKAGMNVNVSIITEQKENCLRVPSSAVNNGAVQLVQDGKTTEVPVTTGISGGGYTEILDGLSEGDTVLLS